ncbi:hypothetical protein J4208_06055 [Candidatus Woesearchaeota archaeon]|nr:hypothetical protein [Candidatus Woesearchaeota archaeon]
MTNTNPELKTFKGGNSTWSSYAWSVLDQCQDEGFQPLYMPTLVDKVVNGELPWDQWFTTPSIKATGETQQGSKVVVYAHIPTDLVTKEGLLNAWHTTWRRDVANGAASIGYKEFQQLVDQDGLTDTRGNRLIWVVDHEILKTAPSETIHLDQVLEHPQTIPFLGGQARTEAYLTIHAKKENTNTFFVSYDDDFNVHACWARLLSRSYEHGDARKFKMLHCSDLNDSAQFVGVRK